MSKQKPDPKKRIISVFLKLIKIKRMTPTRSELHKCGVSQDQYRHHFKTIAGLKEAARLVDPDAFKDMIDEKVFTPKNIKKLKKDLKGFKKFVITTAVTGMPVHKDFYKNLNYYCKENNAKLLILASSDPAAAGGFELDGALANESLVLQDLELNDKLFISTFKTSAKQVNPLTGIKRIGQRERSMIVASPKQFLEYVPIANDKMSHALMTTGAITLPRYVTDHYLSQRTAYIAEFDHKMGAVVVELESDKLYHFRQIQAEYGTGFFVDNGVYYQLNKKTVVRPEAMVLGDIHVGSTSVEMQAATDDQINVLRPKRVFLHDVFDGYSCNHHESHNYLSKARKTTDELSIEFELLEVKIYLEKMKAKHPYVNEWVIVRSNHDIFLDRYLESGDYIKDAINSSICHKLALAKLDSQMPLEAGLKLVGLNASKIKFLKMNDSYRIAGIEHGVHGHLGMNGQRNPGNSSLEIAYGAITAGHSHSSGILREVFRVGTSTDMRLGYNQGASSWTHTNSATYHNASRQLLNLINNKWRS
jgi:hypothetical protein